MLRDALEKLIGLAWSNRVLVVDPDQFLRKTGVEDVAVSMGYELLHYIDAETLRLAYEQRYRQNPQQKVLLVVHDSGAYIPYDIQNAFLATRLSFETLFPGLPASFLRRRLSVDLELLHIASGNMSGDRVKEAVADDFFRQGIYCPENVHAYAAVLLAKCEELLAQPHTHRTWGDIAVPLAKLGNFAEMGFLIGGYGQLLQQVESCFAEWMESGYKMLSGTSDVDQPTMLHRIPAYAARKGKKIALILMDGMSFSNWFVYHQHASRLAHAVTVKATYSFVPTVTSIARQSVFSGALPLAHAQPFSLANEEKQWRQLWCSAGYRNEEIFYGKTLSPDMPEKAKIIGVVVNMIDDLMHAQLQGQAGMIRDIAAWARQDELGMLVNELKRRGFAILITSDHGNAVSIGVGRPKNEGLLTELTCRRARVYSEFALSEVMERSNIKEYAGYYMPKDYRYFVCEQGTCFGDAGKEYIAHGGMTMQEVVVPFIEVEDS